MAEIAAFIAEHGTLGGKLLAHFGSLEEAKATLEDHYAGEYKSLSDYAQEITEETTNIPTNLQFYIDYNAMARDLEINDVFTIETGFEQTHIFWSR